MRGTGLRRRAPWAAALVERRLPGADHEDRAGRVADPRAPTRCRGRTVRPPRGRGSRRAPCRRAPPPRQRRSCRPGRPSRRGTRRRSRRPGHVRRAPGPAARAAPGPWSIPHAEPAARQEQGPRSITDTMSRDSPRRSASSNASSVADFGRLGQFRRQQELSVPGPAGRGSRRRAGTGPLARFPASARADSP